MLSQDTKMAGDSAGNGTPALDVPETVRIAWGVRENYECGAQFFALLVFPLAADSEKRANLEKYLCAAALWARQKREVDAGASAAVDPKYFFIKPEDAKPACEDAEKKIRSRMEAGEMCLAYITSKDGRPPNWLKGVQDVSLNKISDALPTERHSPKQRIWAPALPVIHLATALAFLEHVSANRGQPTTFADYLLNGDLLADLIRQSMHFEALIRADMKFPSSKAALIPVRFA